MAESVTGGNKLFINRFRAAYVVIIQNSTYIYIYIYIWIRDKNRLTVSFSSDPFDGIRFTNRIIPNKIMYQKAHQITPTHLQSPYILFA